MKERIVSKELAIKNANFSLNMEGLSVDDDCKALCEKLLDHEISFDEYLKEIIRLQGLNE